MEFLQTLPAVTLFCVSPKISARARERYRLSASKSDTFDAFVLADTLRHEHRRWRPLSRPSALTAELQAISRDRHRVQHAKVACESRLRAVLDTYHPAPLHLFSDLDRDITLEFIRTYPTPDQARRVGTARMDRFCRRQHYTGRVDPQVLVDRLVPHLLAASPGTTAGKAFTARLFAEELRMHTDHLRAFDARIVQLLDQHPDAPIFLSFTGIGPIVAATLIAEMGDDRGRYPTAEVLLAETGLAPGHQSVRSDPAGPVPLRREPADATRHRLVDVHRRPRRPVVEVHLRSRSGPGPRQVPGAARARRPLGPDPVALLDRPSVLRPGPAPSAGAERRLTNNAVRAPLPNGGTRSRGQGWPQATRRAPALTTARTPPHSGMPEPRP